MGIDDVAALAGTLVSLSPYVGIICEAFCTIYTVTPDYFTLYKSRTTVWLKAHTSIKVVILKTHGRHYWFAVQK